MNEWVNKLTKVLKIWNYRFYFYLQVWFRFSPQANSTLPPLKNCRCLLLTFLTLYGFITVVTSSITTVDLSGWGFEIYWAWAFHFCSRWKFTRAFTFLMPNLSWGRWSCPFGYVSHSGHIASSCRKMSIVHLPTPRDRLVSTILPDMPKISSYLIGSWEKRTPTEHVPYARYFAMGFM